MLKQQYRRNNLKIHIPHRSSNIGCKTTYPCFGIIPYEHTGISEWKFIVQFPLLNHWEDRLDFTVLFFFTSLRTQKAYLTAQSYTYMSFQKEAPLCQSQEIIHRIAAIECCLYFPYGITSSIVHFSFCTFHCTFHYNFAHYKLLVQLSTAPILFSAKQVCII